LRQAAKKSRLRQTYGEVKKRLEMAVWEVEKENKNAEKKSALKILHRFYTA
jgi:hypothetical protein